MGDFINAYSTGQLIPREQLEDLAVERVIWKWILNNYSTDRIHLALDTDSGQALLSMVINHWVV
jgi:hypothetical protein